MDEFLNSVPFAVIVLLAGFFLLVKGADLFVDGSSSIAKKFRIPSIIIGLTVVAMGTSLPETAVSVTASISGNNALAVSNAVGSNIFNLMVVIGFCALFTPIAVKRDSLVKDFPISIVCAALLLVLGLIGMELGHIDGIIFLLLFIGFIVLMVQSALKSRKADTLKGKAEDDDEIKLMPVWKSIIFIIIGGAGIAFGGDMVVEGASKIAEALGMSQTLVGLTIVSIGTSLPELVTSIVAARKKEVDMALGNAIGSNIFNILMVLGLAGAISPIAFITENIIDICILIAFSLIVWLISWTRKKITRPEGLLMLLLYGAYTAYIIARAYI